MVAMLHLGQQGVTAHKVVGVDDEEHPFPLGAEAFQDGLLPGLGAIAHKELCGLRNDSQV